MLTITHEEMARNLATSREVIYRLLKQLEREGQLLLKRNKIELLSGSEMRDIYH